MFLVFFPEQRPWLELLLCGSFGWIFVFVFYKDLVQNRPWMGLKMIRALSKCLWHLLFCGCHLPRASGKLDRHCFAGRGLLREKGSSKVFGAEGTAWQVGMGGTPCFKGGMTCPAGDRQDGWLCWLSSLELCAGPVEMSGWVWTLILFGLSSSLQFFLHFTVLKLFFLGLVQDVEDIGRTLFTDKRGRSPEHLNFRCI